MSSEVACAACVARGKTWNGDDPKCAFPGGRAFDPNNWNCATIGALRDLFDEPLSPGLYTFWADDQTVALISLCDIKAPGESLWLTWYKRRGRTEQAWVLDDSEAPRRPTEAECLAIAQHYAPGRGA